MDKMENDHGNETSKNQTLHPEATGNETSKNQNLNPEATGNGTSKNQSLHSEATGNETSKTQSLPPEATGNEMSKTQSLPHEAASNNENPFIQDKLLDHSASISSSTSSSSSLDPLEIETDGKDPLKISLTKAEDESPTSPPDNSTHTPQWSMISASPRGGGGTGNLSSPEVLNQDWAAMNASPKQSPPVQVMGRPAGYDPNRIPSSVFSTKPTTPMEWSVASNESLFSIHMGNSSFSRDHSILLGKSGELNRMDDWSNSPYSANESKPSDLTTLPAGLPTVIEVAGENGGKTGSIDMDSGEKDVFEHGKGSVGDDEKKKLPTPEEVTTSASDGKGMCPAEGARTSASTPRLSDESGNSAGSFVFPVFGGEGGSPKACPEKPASQQKQQSLAQAESDKKKEPPEPQSRPDTPKAAVGGTRWFSCFSCCPLCC